MELSIVIPAHKEGKKIASDVHEALRFLHDSHLAGELIIVDDGSEDDTAAVVRNAAKDASVPVRVIRHEQNRGKGAAVRTGILASQGKYVMFADAGLCVPYETACIGLDMIIDGECDIAHGSRKIPGCLIQKKHPPVRRICSRLFRWAVRTLLKVPPSLTDTQCGFKVYRGSVARLLYEMCKTDGFVFDIEIILLARHYGYHIMEFPIPWTCDCDSRISIRKTSVEVLREIMNIRRNIVVHKKGQPDDQSSGRP